MSEWRVRTVTLEVSPSMTITLHRAGVLEEMWTVECSAANISGCVLWMGFEDAKREAVERVRDRLTTMLHQLDKATQ